MSADRLSLDHAGLSVADLDAAVAWWSTALDLSVELEFELPGGLMRGAMLRSDAGFRLELLCRPSSVVGLQAGSPVEAALTRGYGHLAFDVPDVDAAYDALVAHGATDRLSPRPSPEAGVRMAYVADPEGNLVELLDRDAAKAAGRYGVLDAPHDPGAAS